MIDNKLTKVLVILLAIVTIACEDLIEKEIEGTVTLYAPHHNAQLDDKDVTFWWNELDNVRGYRLQLVKNSFEQIEKVMLDSTVTVGRFDYTVNPGNYQWRVTAFNDANEVVSDTFSFQIEIITENIIIETNETK